MIEMLIVAGIAILNRVRGMKGAVPLFRDLPGRSVFYIAPLVGLIAWTVQPWLVAALIGLSYLWFNIMAIGRWYTLNRQPREIAGPPSAFEVRVERIAGSNDMVALAIRQSLAVAGLMLSALILKDVRLLIAAVVLIPLTVAAYWLPWLVWDRRPAWVRNPILPAELLVGAAWGAVIALA